MIIKPISQTWSDQIAWRFGKEHNKSENYAVLSLQSKQFCTRFRIHSLKGLGRDISSKSSHYRWKPQSRFLGKTKTNIFIGSFRNSYSANPVKSFAKENITVHLFFWSAIFESSRLTFIFIRENILGFHMYFRQIFRRVIQVIFCELC